MGSDMSGWATLVFALLQALVLLALFALRGQFATKKEVERLVERIIAVEGAQETMPTESDIHGVALSVASLAGDIKGFAVSVGAVNGRMERIEAVCDRVEGYLLNQAGQSQ